MGIREDGENASPQNSAILSEFCGDDGRFPLYIEHASGDEPSLEGREFWRKAALFFDPPVGAAARQAMASRTAKIISRMPISSSQSFVRMLLVGGMAAGLWCALSGAGAAVELDDAVRAALKTNPDVGIVVENRRATEEELEQAEARYFPTFDIRSSYGLEANNNPGLRARLKSQGEGDTAVMGAYRGGFTIRQVLFDGFAISSEIDRQEARIRAAARRVRETSEFIALDAIEAYFEALRQRELVGIAEENVRAHEQTVQMVTAKVQGGAASTADVQQTESRLASARATLAEAEGRLRDADATYTRIVGEDPENLIRPAVPADRLPPSLDGAIDLAIKFNPTVRVSRSDIDIAEAELRATNSSFLPNVNLEISGNHVRNGDGTRGPDSDATAAVVFSYNLYRGGADIHRRREFIARLAESRQRLNRALRLTEEGTRLSWNALISAQDRLKALRAEVSANDQVRATYRQQFDIGQRDLLDLLDSENELFISKSNLVTSEFVELFGVYRILATTGTLLSVLDVQPPRAAFGKTDKYDEIDNAIGGAGAAGTPLDPSAPMLDPNAPAAPVLDPNAPASGPTGGSAGRDVLLPASGPNPGPAQAQTLSPFFGIHPPGMDASASPQRSPTRAAPLEAARPATAAPTQLYGGGTAPARPVAPPVAAPPASGYYGGPSAQGYSVPSAPAPVPAQPMLPGQSRAVPPQKDRNGTSTVSPPPYGYPAPATQAPAYVPRLQGSLGSDGGTTLATREGTTAPAGAWGFR
ncbi:MAG: TolC family outer membrane protein [Alphaproteobacteria bacterium]